MAPSAPRISVALVITGLAPGGAERALTRLAIGLPPAEFAVEVYSILPRPEAGRDLLVHELEQAGIPLHFLEVTARWKWFIVLRHLAGLLRKQQPDIVQTYLMHANVLGAWAAHQAGVTRVVTGLRVAEHRARWRCWLERAAGRWAMRHVAVSESVAQFARARMGLDPAKLLVIPNGVDVERFRAALPADLSPWGVPAGRRAVVCLGRLEPQKGLDWLLEGAPRWLGELPRHDLLLVGQGPERARLERQASDLGISPRVHFTGWAADIPGILKASDLLVLPSRWEGMPNVLLEAMAAGLPVVARAVEGVREVLGDGASHELQVVSQNDAQAFYSSIVTILSQPELRARLGAENQRRAAVNFRWEKTIEQYAGLYRGLAHG